MGGGGGGGADTWIDEYDRQSKESGQKKKFV